MRVNERPTRSDEKPTRVRDLVLAAACALAVLTYVQRQAFVAGMSYIQRDLRLDDREIGILLAAWLAAYGVFQLPGGLLGDRLGARQLLTALVVDSRRGRHDCDRAVARLGAVRPA